MMQCFGKAASDKAKEMLTGKNVRLEMDASQGTFDKYGRTLAYVFLPSGTNFNEYMIAEGYGHEYTYNLPYAHQARFKAAEQRARAEKKGLWADEACAAESERTYRAVTPAPADGRYECSGNTYDCASFQTKAEAEAAFAACGGSANDVHYLDADEDGKVCELLP